MLPPSYRWLYDEPAPKILRAALSDYGIKEFPSVKDNPVILSWADQLGLGKAYRDDSTAWCGLAMAWWTHQAGYEHVEHPLWALNWKAFGNPADTPSLGDVLVFRRKTAAGWAGHVGLYCAEDEGAYHTLGGNTQDQVMIARLARSRLVAARRCPWRIAQPDCVRPVRLASTGLWSANEA